MRPLSPLAFSSSPMRQLVLPRGGALTGNAAILAALQPPAGHHRISRSQVVGTAFHRRPVGRGVPPSRQVGSRVPRDRVSRRQSAPCAQTIPEPNCLTPNHPFRNAFQRACPLGFLLCQRELLHRLRSPRRRLQACAPADLSAPPIRQTSERTYLRSTINARPLSVKRYF